MELRHLRYFVAAAEEKNISRASVRLHISQPAVSRQIKDLEEELGVQLFKRLRDGLELTVAGNSALVHAREVLRQAAVMEEAMEAFHGKRPQATLAVGYILTQLPGALTNALRAFEQRHSDTRIQLYEMTPGQQVEALRQGELDVGLLGMPWSAIEGEFVARVVKRVPMVVMIPADHALASRSGLTLADLQRELFVSFHEDQFPGRPELLERLFRRAAAVPQIVAKARSFSELLGLVAAGRGVAFAPSDLDQFPHVGVAFVKLEDPNVSLASSAIWRRERETPELRSFVDILVQGI
jgi:DNA-binding transcriptional LysR family regulator